MNDKDAWEEISAHVDGEAADPQEVARLIELHPEYAQRLEALRRLSQQVQSLAPPDVHPAFLTRVMAEVAETPAPRLSWFARHRAPVAAACAAVLVVAVGAAVLRNVFAPEAPVQIAGNGHAATDEAALLEALEARIVAGGDPGWAEDGLFSLGNGADVSTDDLIAGLAEEDWFGALALAWDADEDLDTMIGALTEDELAVFNELLQEYMDEEGMTI